MQSFNRRQGLALTGAASVAALAGCGFRLRGAGTGTDQQQYPFRSLYITGTATAMTSQIKRLLASQVQVTDKATDAEAVLTVLTDREQRSASAISTSAQVREVELLQLFDFSLTDASGRILIDAAPIQARRFVSYRENEAVAKEAEFELLFRDMRNDVARQVLRRLAAVRPAP